MADQNTSGQANDQGVFEADEGLLDQETEGLDAGETSAIAGPDWDQDLVDEAAKSTPGETLEGEIER